MPSRTSWRNGSNKHVPAEKLQSLLVGFSVVLSIGLMLVLFMLLPTFLAGAVSCHDPCTP